MVILFYILNPVYGILHILKLYSALIDLVVHSLQLINVVADGDKTLNRASNLM